MQIARSIALLVLLAAAGSVVAAGADSKGMATRILEEPLTPRIKLEVIESAKINALDRYFASVNQAKAGNYEHIRDELIRSVDEYVLSFVVLSEDVDGTPLDQLEDPDKGVYTVVGRAELNLNRLNNKLKSESVVANTPSDERSNVALLFVAREQASVQRFDDKVYKRTDVSANQRAESHQSNTVSESEDIAASSVVFRDSTEHRGEVAIDTSVAVTTGGSSMTRADRVRWEVAPASSTAKAMRGVFARAGYDTVDIAFLEGYGGGLIDLEAVRADYSEGDDLAPATLRNTVQGVQSVDVEKIPYLAIGTLDVHMKGQDASTGLTRVTVTVTAEVLDISGVFPRTASSVGPLQVAALGDSESVARNNALKQAAEAAAKQLTDELNADGFQ